MHRLLTFSMIVIAVAVVLASCRAAECQQMDDCCAAVDDLDGLGAACAELAGDTRDPMTCSDVVRTIGYMLEDRDETVPPSCR